MDLLILEPKVSFLAPRLVLSLAALRSNRESSSRLKAKLSCKAYLRPVNPIGFYCYLYIIYSFKTFLFYIIFSGRCHVSFGHVESCRSTSTDDFRPESVVGKYVDGRSEKVLFDDRRTTIFFTRDPSYNTVVDL